MKRLQLLALGLFALAFGLVTTGCDNQSSVTIKLTDAPGDFKAAVVTISEVYLQGQGGKTVLSDEATTTNLVTLAQDTKDIVKDAIVPEGKYSELRFVISGAYIEVEQEDGSTLIYATSNDYAGLPEGATVAGILQTPSFSSSRREGEARRGRGGAGRAEGHPGGLRRVPELRQGARPGRQVGDEARHQGRGDRLQRQRERDAGQGRGRDPAHRERHRPDAGQLQGHAAQHRDRPGWRLRSRRRGARPDGQPTATACSRPASSSSSPATTR